MKNIFWLEINEYDLVNQIVPKHLGFVCNKFAKNTSIFSLIGINYILSFGIWVYGKIRLAFPDYRNKIYFEIYNKLNRERDADVEIQKQHAYIKGISDGRKDYENELLDLMRNK